MMKKIYNISILLFLFNIAFGQSIIDIEIDEMYLDDENIAFINNGEINTYLCELTPIIKRDFQQEIIIQCEEDNDWMRSDNPKIIEFSQLIEFKNTRQLIDYIKDYKFAKSSNASNKKHHVFLQYFNDNLFARLNFKNYNEENPNWTFADVDFWDYIIIRINRKHFIIALVYEEDPTIGGFLIPTKEEIIVVSENYNYEMEGSRIDTVDITRRIPIENFYRVRENLNGQSLSDKLFQEELLRERFDTIALKDNYIYCVSNNRVQLYDKALNPIDIKNLRVAYDSLGSIQAIIGDEIKWLDYKWNIHDTFPKPNWGLCGTISSTQRKIQKSDNRFHESYTTGYWGQKYSRDSILLIVDNSAETMNYLNNKNQDKYDEYSDLEAVFRFPYNYYLMKREHEDVLIEITNKRDSLERILTIEREYRTKSQTKKDSISYLINELKDEIEIKELFSGKIESFGYNHPLKYKVGELYGYFPQNKNAKYKRIEKFNFFFAEFQDKDGKSGWLDIYGNEYYKKK